MSFRTVQTLILVVVLMAMLVMQNKHIEEVKRDNTRLAAVNAGLTHKINLALPTFRTRIRQLQEQYENLNRQRNELLGLWPKGVLVAEEEM